ncbi:MAG: hypothetical protein DRN37_02005 [Thermoplasmata archaeon]|nr:MAG: hypothetical protein DRN37_02005 [Thermoplasmata archaeon]
MKDRMKHAPFERTNTPPPGICYFKRDSTIREAKRQGRSNFRYDEERRSEWKGIKCSRAEKKH